MVINGCGRRAVQKVRGNCGWMEWIPAMKWDLKDWIAHSARLARWLCGGTRWMGTCRVLVICVST